MSREKIAGKQTNPSPPHSPLPLGERMQGEGVFKCMKRKNIEKCRAMRRNQTDAERKLWWLLRNRRLAEVKFRRQVSIDKYILDFYCPKYKIGI